MNCQQVFGPPLFLHSEGLRDLALCPVCLHLLTSGEHVLCKRADSLVQALHLVLWVGYCPDVSRLHMPWKFNKKITKTKSEVSMDSGCDKSFTNGCVPNLPGIQLAIVLAKKERTYFKDRVMETNFDGVRRSIHIPCQLSDAHSVIIGEGAAR